MRFVGEHDHDSLASQPLLLCGGGKRVWGNAIERAATVECGNTN